MVHPIPHGFQLLMCQCCPYIHLYIIYFCCSCSLPMPLRSTWLCGKSSFPRNNNNRKPRYTVTSIPYCLFVALAHNTTIPMLLYMRTTSSTTSNSTQKEMGGVLQYYCVWNPKNLVGEDWTQRQWQASGGLLRQWFPQQLQLTVFPM